MKKSIIGTAIVLIVSCAVLTSCKGTAGLEANTSKLDNKTKPVNGILEERFDNNKAPDAVKKVMSNPNIDERYECILNDISNRVRVWSLMRCSEEESSEGYGFIIYKEETPTVLTDIVHGNNPLARYDDKSGYLWITGGLMEGTGTHVECPYLLRFNNDGHAEIVNSIDPYDMQQAICKRLGYEIKDEQIFFYDGKKHIHTATNHVKDMGRFDNEAIWIGEQISYDISGKKLKVSFTPGVKFVVGQVLIYDDMPTLTSEVTLSDDGSFILSDISENKEYPFVGDYLDLDKTSDMNISLRDNGKYDVKIGIYRLTNLDDGIGIMTEEGLQFTATDAAGNPISGIITLENDTAIVTFTSSTWEYIENGTQFTYTRKNSYNK